MHKLNPNISSIRTAAAVAAAAALLALAATAGVGEQIPAAAQQQGLPPGFENPSAPVTLETGTVGTLEVPGAILPEPEFENFDISELPPGYLPEPANQPTEEEFAQLLLEEQAAAETEASTPEASETPAVSTLRRQAPTAPEAAETTTANTLEQREDTPLAPAELPETEDEPAVIHSPATETATVGYLGLGLLPNVHYPEDKIIVRYSAPIETEQEEPTQHPNGDPFESPLGNPNQNPFGGGQIGTGVLPGAPGTELEELLEEIEADPIAVAISEDLASLEKDFGISDVQVTGGISERNTYFVRIEGGEFDPLEVSLALNELDSVEYAHPDYYIEFAQSWGACFYGSGSGPIHVPGARDAVQVSPGAEDPCTDADSYWSTTDGDSGYADWYIDDINLDQALEFVEDHKSEGVSDPLVAVIDTGFVRNHPDLDDRWALATDVITGRHHPRDTYDDDDVPFVSRNGVHGSVVTSILAGKRDNGYGAYGVYQGGNATILPLKIRSDDGEYATISAAVTAVERARRSGADVINGSFATKHAYNAPDMSNTYPADSCVYLSDPGNMLRNALRDEIEAFDGLFVAAAHNYRLELGTQYLSAPTSFAFDTLDNNGSPCIDKVDNLINVGATQLQNPATGEIQTWANLSLRPGEANGSGSNYSAQHVHIAAPGNDVFVSNGNETEFTLRNVSGGTSLAAPLVAGTAALMLQVNPNLTPEKIISIINATGRYETSLNGRVLNGKTLDAFASVHCAHTFLSEDINLDPSDACYTTEVGFRTVSEEGYETSRRHTHAIVVAAADGKLLARDATLNLEWDASTTTPLYLRPQFSLLHANGGLETINSITIPAGQAEAQFVLSLYPNIAIEPDRNLVIKLSSTTPGISVVESAKLYTYTILDNDPAPAEFGFRTTGANGHDGHYVFDVWLGTKNGSRNHRGATFKLEIGAESDAARPGFDYYNGAAHWDPVGRAWVNWTPSSNGSYEFTIPPRRNWGQILITVYGTSQPESNESFTLTLSSTSRHATVQEKTRKFTYTILGTNSDPEPSQTTLPEFGFNTSASVNTEDSKWVNVRVSLKNGVVPTRDVRLYVSWTGGNRTPGDDYQEGWYTWNYVTDRWNSWQRGTPHDLTIPAGHRYATFQILLEDDNQREGIESILFTLIAPNANVAVQSASEQHAVLIRDNDGPALPEFGFRTIRASSSESTSLVSFVVDRMNSASQTGDITLNVKRGGSATPGPQSSDSSDYSDVWRTRNADGSWGDWTVRGNSAQLTIPAHSSQAEFQIRVFNNKRGERESNKTIIFTLSSRDTYRSVVHQLAEQHTYTIIDDDDPPEFGFRTIRDSGNEGTDFIFAVELKKGVIPPHDITLDIHRGGTAIGSVKAGALTYSDYWRGWASKRTILANGHGPWQAEEWVHNPDSNITIPQGSRGLEFRIRVNDNMPGQDEGDETIIYTLSSPDTSRATIKAGKQRYTYTILDDDLAPEFGFRTTSDSGHDDRSQVSVVVEIKNGATLVNPVTLNLRRSGSATPGRASYISADYEDDLTWQGDHTSITIPAGATQAEFQITVRNNHPQRFSPEETIIYTLSSTDTSITVQSAFSQFTYTILADRIMPEFGFRITSAEGNDSTSPVTVVVELKNGVLPRQGTILHVERSGSANPYWPDYSDSLAWPGNRPPITIWDEQTELEFQITVYNSQRSHSDTIIYTLSAPSTSEATIKPGKERYTYTILPD